jgi:hypothetical protein
MFITVFTEACLWTHASYFWKMHLNVIVPSAPRYSIPFDLLNIYYGKLFAGLGGRVPGFYSLGWGVREERVMDPSVSLSTCLSHFT